VRHNTVVIWRHSNLLLLVTAVVLLLPLLKVLC
jgi:hypothetical protein